MKKYIQWQTPFSLKDFIFVDKISDGDMLSFVLSSRKEKIKISFDRYVTYKVTLEEFTTNVSPELSGRQKELGPTRIIEGSDWIEKMMAEETQLEIQVKHLKRLNKLKHYEIAGGDKVIEIISDSEPQIQLIA